MTKQKQELWELAKAERRKAINERLREAGLDSLPEPDQPLVIPLGRPTDMPERDLNVDDE